MKKIQSRVKLWNKALWLDVSIQLTNQSALFQIKVTAILLNIFVRLAPGINFFANHCVNAISSGNATNKVSQNNNQQLFSTLFSVSYLILHWRKSKVEYLLNPHPVWPEKTAKCLQKLPKNDFNRKMIDFDTFTSIA